MREWSASIPLYKYMNIQEQVEVILFGQKLQAGSAVNVKEKESKLNPTGNPNITRAYKKRSVAEFKEGNYFLMGIIYPLLRTNLPAAEFAGMNSIDGHHPSLPMGFHHNYVRDIK